MPHKDTIAGLALLALAAGYFLATRGIPDSSLSDAVGATGLPYVLAGALAVLAAMLIVKGLMASRIDPPSRSGGGGGAGRAVGGGPSFPTRQPSAVTLPASGEGSGGAAHEDEAEERSTPARALGFVLIGIGYMGLAPLTGYPLGIALLVVAIALYERERLSWRLVGVAAGGGIGFWLVFVKLLGTDQPISRLLG